MAIVKRFLLLVLMWTAAIMLLIVPISLATVHGLTVTQHLRWLGHSLALASFPAGLMVGADVFRNADVWKKIGALTLAEILVMLIVLLLLINVAPPAGFDFGMLLNELRTVPHDDWLTWNQRAWSVYFTFAEVVSVPIYAGLGMMLGAWAEQVLPTPFRRILFWAMGLKMVGFTYLITENSYEMLVIRTDGPAAFSAFFMLLVPLGMYGGLILPSIALANKARRR